MTSLPIAEKPSPNFGERWGGVKPTIIVLHYTGTDTAAEAEKYYLNLESHELAGRISPHYMIDLDGSITRYVDESKRAWHAGHSFWEGSGDINSHSIGIELVNPGHDRGYVPFTPDQMNALALLCKDIVLRNDIPAHRILGHSDISPHPDRNKPDPGELMDWFWLASHGVGLWPTPETQDYDTADQWVSDPGKLHQALGLYGYDTRVDLPHLITAFQRHFQPEIFKSGNHGKADRETAARLSCLLRMKNTCQTPSA